MYSKKITNDMVINLYDAFKKVYTNNQEIFENMSMKEIKKDVLKLLSDDEITKWNKNSIQMYLDDLIYAMKGKKFTRFLNKFAYKYFENNLCKDFPSRCKDIQNAFDLHFKYKKEIQKKYRKKI